MKPSVIPDDQKVRTTRCTNHCASCGLHFHSVAAFDLHREGDHASNDPELGRHCVHPLDKTSKAGSSPFAVLTDNGVCDLRDGLQIGVTLWTVGAALERAREMWKAAA